MELKQYLRLLWRWSWLMALITALAGITAYVVSSQTVPVYEASITLLINQTSAGSASPDLNSLRTSEGLARTYVELLRKRPVLEAVIAKLKLNTDPEQLTKLIQVTVIRDTQLMVLAVEDTNPQRAADIANEIVRAFSQQNREL